MQIENLDLKIKHIIHGLDIKSIGIRVVQQILCISKNMVQCMMPPRPRVDLDVISTLYMFKSLTLIIDMSFLARWYRHWYYKPTWSDLCCQYPPACHATRAKMHGIEE